jgi:DNA-binding transcriptional regulator YiaG
MSFTIGSPVPRPYPGRFADLLGIGLSTLRSGEQNKREPSGAARMLSASALKHPEVLQKAVA